jgi:hypothetical protein
MAIASVNAASATSPNWLKEAQQSIAASASPGGLLGTLQDATASNPGSIRTFLAKSQNNMNAFAQIAQSNQSAAGSLAAQMSAAANDKLRNERVLLAQKMNPQQTNYNPPTELDPVIYFEDGGSLDTSSNILTMASGKQIDTTTGLQYHDPKSIISMANGAYLDTQNNILTMGDGTQMDAITGLKITV